MNLRSVPVRIALCLSFLIQAVRGVEDAGQTAQAVTLTSPDGAIGLAFQARSADDPGGLPVFSVSYKGQELLHRSHLGLALEGSGTLGGGLAITETRLRSHDGTAMLGFGKASQGRDNYREAAISLEERSGSRRRLGLVFRAYDDGIAFRYLIPVQPSLSGVAIREELTSLAFTGSPRAHYLALDFGSAYESFYSHAPLRDIGAASNIGLPLLLEYPDGVCVAVTEAELTDYAGLYLGVVRGTTTLESRLAPSLLDKEVKVRGKTPFASPWRVVLVSSRPGSFLESNTVHLLNPEATIGDTGWIHPGKVVFGWWNGYSMPDAPPFVAGVNTPTIKRFIDFAAENGIPFVSLDGTNDEAWYGGPTFQYGGNDITKANPALNLPEVFAYARARNVGIRLWMHWRGLAKYMDTALPLYEKWGVSGIMVDFINGDSQEMVRFVTRVARETARHHLTVNFHGVYKPTGIERTYPNLVSYEGVLGTEYDKWDRRGSTPEHEMDTLFVRMIAGPLDIHQGSVHPVVPEKYVPDNRPSTQGTITRQMASYVLYDNPLPMLADSVSAYRAHPDLLPYLRDVPTYWDETRVLGASIDHYLILAKRKAERWYVACAVDRTARQLDIPLGFLGLGDFVAEIYSDGRDADVHPESLEVARFLVSAKDVLHARLSRAGGFAASLTPAPPHTSLPRYR